MNTSKLAKCRCPEANNLQQDSLHSICCFNEESQEVYKRIGDFGYYPEPSLNGRM